jgi:putative transposase
VDAGELQLTGDGGFIPEMIKAVLERGLQAELTDHLGYEKGDPAGRGSPNMRNGTSPKTVLSEIGALPLDIPRDRAAASSRGWCRSGRGGPGAQPTRAGRAAR